MGVIVAVASSGSPKFAVINFGNTPPTFVMTPGFDGGNVVDCYGTLAVVGECSGSTVAIFDISVPASPVQIGSTKTIFQIGSISTNGTWVVAGELNGSRVALIDISTPASPTVLSTSDCAPLLNIISNVAIRSKTAVVSGDNNSVALWFQDPPVGAVPVQILYNATGPSDYDGSTAAVAFFGGITAYALSGHTATELAHVPYTEVTGSVAVAEIPAGGYYVAAAGIGSFTVFAYPSTSTMGSVLTPLQKGMSSNGTVVKFLNNPAIAPFLAVANVTGKGVYVSYYFINLETGPSGTKILFFTPIPVVEVGLATATEYVLTLGITEFTPRRIFWPFPWPLPMWLEKILRALGL